jgi:hypothetical protein
MAGVIVPTAWLGIMAAFPYFDRDTEARGHGLPPRAPSG